MIKYEQTQYGFKFGAADVTRVCSDDKKGWVYLEVQTPRQFERIQIYVTRTGKTRVYKNGLELK